MPIAELILGQLVLLMLHTVDATRGYPWLEQISRQEVLRSVCDNLGLYRQEAELKELDHILVDDKHRLLYCYVPKVACTNWKRVLMVLTNRSNVTNLVDIPATKAHAENSTIRISELDEPTAKRILNDYVLFVMVRHPFERLVSAFRNKFENDLPSGKYFQARYGRHIIKTYRRNATEAEITAGADVTFTEFVKYLLNEGVRSNEHWRPIYELCAPCSLNYTFIGRYERLAEDSRMLLDMVGAPVGLGFPQTRNGGTKGVLKGYFQELSLGEIEGLYRLYELDFRLFGYGLSDILGFDIG